MSQQDNREIEDITKQVRTFILRPLPPKPEMIRCDEVKKEIRTFIIRPLPRPKPGIIRCDGKMCGMGKYTGRSYVCPHNNLAVLRPDLMREWDYERNIGIDPRWLAVYSNKKVWWKCSKSKCDHHTWIAAISDRSKGHGCPFCVGQRTCICSSVYSTHPDMVKEWDPSNIIKPWEVSSGSDIKILFRCQKAKCDHHVWEARVNDRSGGKGCPFCVGKRTCICSSVYSTHPEIAIEWDPSNIIKPWEVSSGSGIKILFRCAKGHRWITTPNKRSLRGSGCPACSPSQYSKKAIRWLESIATEQKISIQHAENGGEVSLSTKDGNVKVDGYCSDTNTAFEFHGDFWHGNPDMFDQEDINPRSGKTYGELYQRTMKKEERIKDAGYKLVVIWECDFHE